MAVVAASILVARTPLHHKGRRIALFVIEAFIGVTAIQGGIGLLRGTFDQVLRVAWLAGTPFSDYTIPGLVLLMVVGGSACSPQLPCSSTVNGRCSSRCWQACLWPATRWWR
jgi:hypothetical protein